MIEFSDLASLIHRIHHQLGIAVDWFTDVFLQVGLVAVIWVGYVRHWVSSNLAFNVTAVGRVSLRSSQLTISPKAAKEEVFVRHPRETVSNPATNMHIHSSELNTVLKSRKLDRWI